MSDFYLGEIRLLAFGAFTPVNFLPCNGQLVKIAEYQALYSLIGTTYGGDAVNTFGLPDLRGRSPVAIGTPPKSTNNYALGVAVGKETVAVTVAQTPPHVHTVSVATGPATTTIPGPSVVQSAVPPGSFFYCNANQAGTNQTLAVQTVGYSAGNQAPHSNMQPSIVLQYAICVNGLYPQFN
jgi:microcystin-dependent protein